jgi:predicted  nucleic acid-binding Zn-ribbon protein
VETASIMTLEALKQLDDRIQASVNRIQQLQRENEALVKQLAESEQRFNEAQTRSNIERQQHETERNEIKTRIEKILARFDGLDLD